MGPPVAFAADGFGGLGEGVMMAVGERGHGRWLPGSTGGIVIERGNESLRLTAAIHTPELVWVKMSTQISEDRWMPRRASSSEAGACADLQSVVPVLGAN